MRREPRWSRVLLCRARRRERARDLQGRRGQTNAQSHFPNGRALADDVTDTLLTVACSAIGDGVNKNDLEFTTTFPYLASPHSGNP